jgi:ACS family hexuronate transporter-like MFS transporter
MSVPIPDNLVYSRGRSWKWWVCGLLLLATTINYMDRLTLNQMSKLIMDHFQLNERDYGQLESAFGSAFAIGAIIAGWLADRVNVRWLYALAVLAWSLAGFCTGLAQGFLSLLILRFLLGLAEAGNWPCALRTTQHILTPAERAMGNGILQSGAAVGAVLTPLIVLLLVGRNFSDPWRYPFLVIGAVGMLWVFFWLGVVKKRDLERRQVTASVTLLPVVVLLVALLGVDVAVHLYFADPVSMPALAASTVGLLTSPDGGALAAASAVTPGRAAASWVPLIVKVIVTAVGIGGVFVWLWTVTSDDQEMDRRVFLRRFWVLALVVVVINATWHYFRVWLPLFLQRVHHYSLADTQWFGIAYYASTDIGSLTAGYLALRLARGGMAVHWSRVLVFSCCALITTASTVAAYLPAGPLLLGVFLVIGFAALGLFPNYYSFSQELTVRHQGKLTGALGCICWLSMSLLHEVVGDSIVRTGSYSEGVAAAGLLPLLAVAALLLFWGKTAVTKPPPADVDLGPLPPAHPEAVQPSAAVVLQK